MRHAIIALLLTHLATACGDEPCPGPDENSSQREIRGYAIRTIPLPSNSDGVGTLYVAALSECDFRSTLLGAAGVPEANLFAPDDEVDFVISDLPAGSIHLAAFLDDNQDADPKRPQVGATDLVHAPSGVGDGHVDCIEVDTAEASIHGVRVELDGVAP